ncbi:MAG: glycerophosphodiester phosphodiesterase [Gemmatimonadaceae bacterium]|nr:glycerophosphodiester phosphodiesterase [Gemmatimonadaceae bacterium]
MPRLARENTLPSFQLALDVGADGLELDVHTTADGVVVVHHDPDLAAGPRIDALTLGELRRHEAAPRVPIPTLEELCTLVQGRATLFVELKGAAVERAVLDVLAAYDGPVALHSFDHAMIRRTARLSSERRLGILYDDAPVGVAREMAETGALDVWPHWKLVTEELVAEVHEAGGRVIPWTVNDPSTAQALASLGVDGLCGDDVRIL